MQAFFDESETPDKGIICVAGYLFLDKDYGPFAREWRIILAEFGVSRFHMVDCVHGRRSFGSLEHDARRVLVQHLVGEVKRRALLSAVVSVDVAAYEKVTTANPIVRESVGSPYALCLMQCIAGISRWLKREEVEEDEICYFIEGAGTKQKEARHLLRQVAEHTHMKPRYRYLLHDFVAKGKAAGLEAADMLAWEWTQHCKRLQGTEPRPARMSLRSLLEKAHIGVHCDRRNIHMALAHQLLEPYVFDVDAIVKAETRHRPRRH